MTDKKPTIEEYNEKSYAVRGDRAKWGKQINNIGGRWNGKMKGGEGWTVPKDKKNTLEKLLGVKVGEVADDGENEEEEVDVKDAGEEEANEEVNEEANEEVNEEEEVDEKDTEGDEKNEENEEEEKPSRHKHVDIKRSPQSRSHLESPKKSELKKKLKREDEKRRDVKREDEKRRDVKREEMEIIAKRRRETEAEEKRLATKKRNEELKKYTESRQYDNEDSPSASEVSDVSEDENDVVTLARIVNVQTRRIDRLEEEAKKMENLIMRIINKLRQ